MGACTKSPVVLSAIVSCLLPLSVFANVDMPDDTYLSCGEKHVVIETSYKRMIQNKIESKSFTGVRVFELYKGARANYGILEPNKLGIVKDRFILVRDHEFLGGGDYRIDRVNLTLEDFAIEGGGQFGTIIYVNPRKCAITSKDNLKQLVEDHNKSVGATKF